MNHPHTPHYTRPLRLGPARVYTVTLDGSRPMTDLTRLTYRRLNMRGDSVTRARPANQPTGDGALPISPLFNKGDWWVDAISIATARRMVQRYHYAAGASNTAVYLHGLYPRGELWESRAAGIAWWIPPTRTAAEAVADNWQGVLALSRIVIVPGIATNAASYLMRHSMQLIDRDKWPVLLTYADDWRGHTGTIYRAAGWTEAGKTKPERLYIRNGRILSRKAGPRTRTHAEMLAIGCECLGAFAKTRFVCRT